MAYWLGVTGSWILRKYPSQSTRTSRSHSSLNSMLQCKKSRCRRHEFAWYRIVYTLIVIFKGGSKDASCARVEKRENDFSEKFTSVLNTLTEWHHVDHVKVWVTVSVTYITQRHRISVKRVQNYKYKIAIFEPACFALVVFYPRLHKRITGCMNRNWV